MAVAVERPDAGVLAGYVDDLRQELLEPPEFVPCAAPLPPARRARGRGDGVDDWLAGAEAARTPDERPREP